MTFGVGFFIAGFLYFFRPFNFGELGDLVLWVSLGFGAVTVICVASYEWLVPRLLRLEMDLPSWTLWKWLVYTLGLLGWIALGNLILIDVINPGAQFSFKNWLVHSLPQTVAIGLFPVIFSGLYIQLRAAKKHQRNAQEIQLKAQEVGATEVPNQDAAIRLDISDNSSDALIFTPEQFLFAQAMQNYVEVVLLKDGQIERHLIRSTLSTLARAMRQQSEQILQSHRSFLLNIAKVTKVEGNAQGLKLALDGLADQRVPVSRTFIAPVRAALGNS